MRVEDANSSSVSVWWEWKMLTASSSVSVWWEWKMLTVVVCSLWWQWKMLTVVMFLYDESGRCWQ